MIQYILGAGVIYILKEILSEFTDKSITEFTDDDIITDYAKFFTSKQETVAKIHITKSLNKLVKGKGKFKIGKSGVPQTKISNIKVLIKCIF